MQRHLPVAGAFFLLSLVVHSPAQAGDQSLLRVDEPISFAALPLIDGDEDLRWQGDMLEASGPKALQTAWTTAPIAFTALGSHWYLTGQGSFDLELQVDTRADRWYSISAAEELDEVAPDLPDGRPNPAYGNTIGELLLLGARPATQWRARLVFHPGASPLRLHELNLVFIDAGSGREFTGEVEFAPLPEDEAFPKPPVYSRAAWGADPPQCTSGYCSVTHLGTHHTATPGAYDSSGFSECASNVRGIQDYHMYTRGWCDIGYNYLVCKHGKVWEGRDGGDDVRAAHDGHNCGSMGVAGLGYFHTPYNDIPTAALLDVFEELYAWKADQKGIDPFGRDYYVGYGDYMDNIYGHRDVSPTACPGDLFYDDLPGIRAAVDDLIGGGGLEWIYDNPSARTRGSWTTGNTAPGRYGSNYLWTSTESGGNKLCYWDQTINEAGTYKVWAWWSEGSNRSNQTQYGVRISGTTHKTRLNQQTSGGQWNLIGSYWMPRGRVLFGLSNNAPAGYVVIGDAMMLEKQ